MRHAAARQHDGPEPHTGDGALHGLAEAVTALDGRLRREIGIHIDRQHRLRVTQMRERDPHRIVEFCRAGEGRVETLAVEIAHKLEAHLARYPPMKFAAGEFPACLAADVNGEGRRHVLEELLRVIVREEYPEFGLQSPELLADICREGPDALDGLAILGLGHGEELRSMRQHRAADHGRAHQPSSPPLTTRGRLLITGRLLWWWWWWW